MQSKQNKLQIGKSRLSLSRNNDSEDLSENVHVTLHNKSFGVKSQYIQRQMAQTQRFSESVRKDQSLEDLDLNLLNISSITRQNNSYEIQQQNQSKQQKKRLISQLKNYQNMIESINSELNAIPNINKTQITVTDIQSILDQYNKQKQQAKQNALKQIDMNVITDLSTQYQNLQQQLHNNIKMRLDTQILIKKTKQIMSQQQIAYIQEIMRQNKILNDEIKDTDHYRNLEQQCLIELTSSIKQYNQLETKKFQDKQYIEESYKELTQKQQYLNQEFQIKHQELRQQLNEKLEKNASLFEFKKDFERKLFLEERDFRTRVYAKANQEVLQLREQERGIKKTQVLIDDNMYDQMEKQRQQGFQQSILMLTAFLQQLKQHCTLQNQRYNVIFTFYKKNREQIKEIEQQFQQMHNKCQQHRKLKKINKGSKNNSKNYSFEKQ